MNAFADYGKGEELPRMRQDEPADHQGEGPPDVETGETNGDGAAAGMGGGPEDPDGAGAGIEDAGGKDTDGDRPVANLE